MTQAGERKVAYTGEIRKGYYSDEETVPTAVGETLNRARISLRLALHRREKGTPRGKGPFKEK